MSIHSMQITLEPDSWHPTYRAMCSNPAADCHYICAEGCETWGEILRNEDGAVIGHVVNDWAHNETPHQMEHVEECNYIAFFDNSDCVDEMMEGKALTFTVPAKFTFDGCDDVTWQAAE